MLGRLDRPRQLDFEELTWSAPAQPGAAPQRRPQRMFAGVYHFHPPGAELGPDGRPRPVNHPFGSGQRLVIAYRRGRQWVHLLDFRGEHVKERLSRFERWSRPAAPGSIDYPRLAKQLKDTLKSIYGKDQTISGMEDDALG